MAQDRLGQIVVQEPGQVQRVFRFGLKQQFKHMLTWELFDRNGISATCTNLRCQMLLPAFALLPIKTFLMDQPWPLFVYFCSFQAIYAIKTEDFCGI